MIKIANVALKHRSKYVDKEYSYLADETILQGTRVLVPFGKGNIPYEAIVTKIYESEENEETRNLKPVIRALGGYQLPDKKIELARWIRKEYMSSLIEALGLFMPKTEELTITQQTFLAPIANREMIQQGLENEKKSARNKKMLLQLLLEGEVNISKLQKELGKSLIESAKSVESSGFGTIEKRRTNRLPQSNYQVPQREIHFSKEQEQVLEKIQKNVQNSIPTLLHGVTGSGKTELYIQLIQNCLAEGKQAIVLVPEISLTPQTIARFQNVFGKKIGVFHSKISQGERKDQTDMILAGEIDIVIGARSAIFVPFERLGLIVVDECHDDAYKSEQSPKYDGVKVSEKLCEAYGAALVLGTATPTIEQYHEAVYGKYDLQVLKRREKGQLPQIEILDTREENKYEGNPIISIRVIAAIQEQLDLGKQVIVFLNKRGYATTLSCNNCNHTIMCPRCDISLTYHKQGGKLVCHYCGHQEEVRKKCTACGIGDYKSMGYGTQKIEAELNIKIQGAKTVRLDKDTTAQKGGHENLLKSFKDKEKNILIGTQMISKGLDFEDVNLVVILEADQGLRFPDYRSAEKTLSTIMQVSGRAGRGDSQGKVILQTNDSQNKIFEYALNQDYSGFFWDEIKERKAFSYPPFASLIRILCSSEDAKNAGETAEKIKDAIEFYLKKKNKKVEALGPVPSLIHKIDNKYRWQLFFKITEPSDFELIKSIISFILSEKRSIIVNRNTAVSVEINPKSLI